MFEPVRSPEMTLCGWRGSINVNIIIIVGTIITIIIDSNRDFSAAFQ